MPTKKTEAPAPDPDVLQRPGVGRIVHVAVRTQNDQTVPRPGIITHVWSDQCVNATVFYEATDEEYVPCTGPVPVTSMMHGSGVGEWSWPPRV